MHRFQGNDGFRRLITAMRLQRIVQNDEALATDIAHRITLRQLNPGDDLITQGSIGTDAYFIVSGELLVLVNRRETGRRAAGTHVGEMALIDPTALRSATLRAITPTVVAAIPEPSFAQLADRYPHIWRPIALELAHRLRERARHLTPPNDTPHLFIGCSTETLDIATAIQDRLQHDLTTSVWTDDVFAPSTFPVEALLAAAGQHDFAVFILSPDDLLTSRDATTPAPRDNVVFEFGLFMGALGRHRVFAIKARGSTVKMPTDLLGLTPLDYAPGNPSTLAARIAPACNTIRRHAKALGPR